MPFGKTNTPQEFQRRLNETKEGLKGVKVIAGNFHVFWCGDSDEEAENNHDRNFKTLLLRAWDINL